MKFRPLRLRRVVYDHPFLFSILFIKRIKMKIKTHEINDSKIAELLSEENLINTTEEGIDILGNLYYQGFDKVIIHQKILLLTFSNSKIEWQVKSFKSFRRIVFN